MSATLRADCRLRRFMATSNPELPALPRLYWLHRSLTYRARALLLTAGGQATENFEAIGQGYEDGVNIPLSVAIKKTAKPVKHW